MIDTGQTTKGSANITVIEAALKYAARGWQVFPCRPNMKTTGLKSWKSEDVLSADPEKVRKLFKDSGDSNIGFIVPRGLFVLDVDTKEGKLGVASLALLEAQHGKLPEAPRQRTASGGYHLLFRLPEGVEVGISAGLVGKDLDVRSGGGGYIIVEPSKIDGAGYHWENCNPLARGTLDIPLCPDWLIALATKNKFAGTCEGGSNIIAHRASKRATIDEDAEFERISSALFAIPAELADDYDTWYQLGISLKNHSVENFDLWCKWSSQSSKFSEEESAAKWKSFSLKDGGKTIASLIKLALDNGWKDTTSLSGWQENGVEAFTDMGNVQRLMRCHGENLRYCREAGAWLHWNGGRWAWCGEVVMQLAQNTVKQIALDAVKASGEGKHELYVAMLRHNLKCQSLKSLENMIKLAQSEISLVVGASQLDADPYLLNVLNGTVNLKTGLLRESSRRDLISKQAHVVYDNTAKCPIWLAYLDKVFAGDTELISFMQRAIGYSLTGMTSEQIMLVCFGLGSNGKSLLLSVLAGLLGDHAGNAQSSSIMAQKNDEGIRNDLAKLRGSRFVSMSEVPEGSRIAEAQLKQITGSDMVSARFLYKEYFDFIPTFKIWMTCNHRPVISGTDLGIWRRIVLVPFNVTIADSEKDLKLSDKLKGEYSGILNWALQGCLDWQGAGLAAPKIIKDAVANYKSEMDWMGQWLAECCEIKKGVECRASGLYANYKAWAELNGFGISSSRTLGLKLTERGFNKRLSNGTVYDDIKLLLT